MNQGDFSRLLACAGPALALLAFCSYATTAAAEEAAENDEDLVEEVIVTARKRDESLMEIPESVSAISGFELDQQHISHINDIGLHGDQPQPVVTGRRQPQRDHSRGGVVRQYAGGWVLRRRHADIRRRLGGVRRHGARRDPERAAGHAVRRQQHRRRGEVRDPTSGSRRAFRRRRNRDRRTIHPERQGDDQRAHRRRVRRAPLCVPQGGRRFRQGGEPGTAQRAVQHRRPAMAVRRSLGRGRAEQLPRERRRSMAAASERTRRDGLPAVVHDRSGGHVDLHRRTQQRA